MKNRLAFVLFLALNSLMYSQDVTEIWTNYDGFWRSSSTSINPVKPENSHELLAFRFGTTVFSTGVDDALLTSNSVVFTPLEVRALPIASLPTSGGGSYFIGLGQLFDGIDNGVDNGPTNPFSPISSGTDVARFLTDGEQGLDLGTNVTNIASGVTARFNLSSAGINLSNVNDGVPDILVSQTAQPSTNNPDVLRFIDALGNTVGNSVQLIITAEPSVGNWTPDFYNFNSTQTQPTFINTDRPIRFFAVDLADFGINASNISNAVALTYSPNGNSDPSFIAFNEPSLGVATQLSVILQPTQQNCDGTLQSDIQVQLADQNGNAVAQAGILVTAFLETGPGVLNGTTSQLTDGTGTATFDDLSFSVGGPHTIRFSFAGLDDAITNTIGDATGCSIIQWTGATDSQWDIASNWSPQEIPDANNDVIIPNTFNGNPIINYPILDADAGARDLTMGSNASIDLNGFLFVLNGSLTNVSTGAFIDASTTNSNLYFSDSSALQTIPFGLLSESVANITIDNPNGVSLLENVDLTETLNLESGVLTIDSSVTFTFKSTSTQTAVLNEVNTGASITGCVVVERYIPPKRAFRYIGSPVNTSVICGKSTIKDNIQEGEQVLNRFDYNPPGTNPDFGTHITGSATQTVGDQAQNGFDATQTGNPSMFKWNESGQTFESILNTDRPIGDPNHEPLNVSVPYAILIRGGRDMDLNINNTQLGNETTLRFTGELVVGDQVAPNLTNTPNAYNLIANPYQAQVNLGTLLSTNTRDVSKTKAWVFDPSNAGTFGAFTLLNFDNLGNLVMKIPMSSNANEFLQANQSFFTENTSAASNVSVTFKESQKKNVNEEITTNVFSDVFLNSSGVSISVDLLEALTNDVRDGIHLRYADDYSNDYVQNEDAFKFWNYLESLSIVNNNQHLTLDSRTLDSSIDIVPLHVTNYTETAYKFNIFIENPSGMNIYLVDKYLNTQHPLNGGFNVYSFNVDLSIPESEDSDRFEILLEQTSLGNTDFSQSELVVYPNPTNKYIRLQTKNESEPILFARLFDIVGRQIKTINQPHPGNDWIIDMSTLSKGVYILKVKTEHNSFEKKIIKE